MVPHLERRVVLSCLKPKEIGHDLLEVSVLGRLWVNGWFVLAIPHLDGLQQGIFGVACHQDVILEVLELPPLTPAALIGSETKLGHCHSSHLVDEPQVPVGFLDLMLCLVALPAFAITLAFCGTVKECVGLRGILLGTVLLTVGKDGLAKN